MVPRHILLLCAYKRQCTYKTTLFPQHKRIKYVHTNQFVHTVYCILLYKNLEYIPPMNLKIDLIMFPQIILYPQISDLSED